MVRAPHYYHHGYDPQNLENFQHYQNYHSLPFHKSIKHGKGSTQEGQGWSRSSSAEYEAVERDTSPPSDHLEFHYILPDSPGTHRNSCSPPSSVVSSEDDHLINGLNKKQRIAAARDRYRKIPRDEPKPSSTSRSEYVRNRRLREKAILAQNPSELSPEEQAKAEQILEKKKRNAERVRLKYQSMSVEDRRRLNRMREATRKKRPGKTADARTKGSRMHMDDDAYGQEPSHSADHSNQYDQQ